MRIESPVVRHEYLRSVVSSLRTRVTATRSAAHNAVVRRRPARNVHSLWVGDVQEILTLRPQLDVRALRKRDALQLHNVAFLQQQVLHHLWAQALVKPAPRCCSDGRRAPSTAGRQRPPLLQTPSRRSATRAPRAGWRSQRASGSRCAATLRAGRRAARQWRARRSRACRSALSRSSAEGGSTTARGAAARVRRTRVARSEPSRRGRRAFVAVFQVRLCENTRRAASAMPCAACAAGEAHTLSMNETGYARKLESKAPPPPPNKPNCGAGAKRGRRLITSREEKQAANEGSAPLRHDERDQACAREEQLGRKRSACRCAPVLLRALDHLSCASYVVHTLARRSARSLLAQGHHGHNGERSSAPRCRLSASLLAGDCRLLLPLGRGRRGR